MSDHFGLAGKRVMVLGGGAGMGEATVRLLAELGASVAVVDREADRAEQVAKAAARPGVVVAPFHFDVTDDDAAIAGIARVERELGPLDGMASIVGMAAWVPLLEMDVATWDLEQSRNLRYFFVAAREVARSMITRGAGGSLVCVSSVDGLRSAGHHAAYGAAKAGLQNLVKSMASEWSPYGVRINSVAPGSTITPRFPLVDAEAERKSLTMVPMRRRGTVDDIAKAITFFLSDLSPYCTGQTLAIDGGYTGASGWAAEANPPPPPRGA